MKWIGILCVIFPAWTIHAQESFNLYHLVVASGHYEQDSKKFREKNFIPYDNLPEAVASAELMERLLTRYGKSIGISLLSNEKNKLTKRKVLHAVDSLIQLVRKAKPKNPLLVIYYCGHGIAENLGWNQFLIPGNYTAIPGTKNLDQLSTELIYLGEITDKLSRFGKNYMVLVDCCRKEEKDNSLPEEQLNYFFDPQNVETFRTVAAGFKFLNEYHQTNPVVFSISPGNNTPVVDLPVNDLARELGADTTTQVGPICRRVIKGLGRLKADGDISIALYQFVTMLTNPQLDDVSPVSVSFYQIEEDAKRKMNILHF